MRGHEKSPLWKTGASCSYHEACVLQTSGLWVVVSDTRNSHPKWSACCMLPTVPLIMFTSQKRPERGKNSLHNLFLLGILALRGDYRGTCSALCSKGQDDPRQLDVISPGDHTKAKGVTSSHPHSNSPHQRLTAEETSLQTPHLLLSDLIKRLGKAKAGDSPGLKTRWICKLTRESLVPLPSCPVPPSSMSSPRKQLDTLLSHRNLLPGNQGHQLLSPLCDFSP